MLSQTVEYALRAMAYLATLAPDDACNSEAIANRTHVPRGYLSKVLRDLVVAQLIHSQRGPSGGFTLARKAQSISLLEIVNAVDPIQRVTRCPLGNSSHLKLCPLHRRLDNAIGLIEDEFARTSLAEVLEENTLMKQKTKQHCPGVATTPIRVRVARGRGNE
ncbi:MAG: Rrf2 family transcriptional regulator [Planctomycetota bacterium]|nr:Rrf2 family transcriptional regulator [Planctomycetota bacterium]